MIVLGSVLVLFWTPEPLGAHRSWEIGPLGGPRPSWDRLGSLRFFVLRFGFAFLTLLGSSWGRLEAPLAPFWAVLASLGLVLGLSGGHCEAFNFFLVFLFFVFVAAGLA